MEIRNAAVRGSVARLTEKYNELMDLLVVLSETGTLRKIDGLKSVGHWGMNKGSEIGNDFGISSEQGQLFHAQGDNMEGSLYMGFSGTVLRIRWAGHLALYLGTTANYVAVEYRKEGDQYILEPSRFNNEPIVRIEEDRVVVEDRALGEYTHNVWMLRMEYENQVRQARTLPSRVPFMISRLFGKGAAEPTLVLPQPPPPAYRSIEELVCVIDTMRDGIERTIDILAPYAAPTASEHR